MLIFNTVDKECSLCSILHNYSCYDFKKILLTKTYCTAFFIQTIFKDRKADY